MWVVLPMLIVMAGLWMHGPVRLSRVLRSRRRRWMLDLRLWVGGALRGDDPRRHEELVNGGTQVSHLGSIKRPVAELRLSHALLQTWQREEAKCCDCHAPELLLLQDVTSFHVLYFIVLICFFTGKLMHELLICICSACSARQEKNKQRKNRKRSDIRENLLLN